MTLISRAAQSVPISVIDEIYAKFSRARALMRAATEDLTAEDADVFCAMAHEYLEDMGDAMLRLTRSEGGGQ